VSRYWTPSLKAYFHPPLEMAGKKIETFKANGLFADCISGFLPISGKFRHLCFSQNSPFFCFCFVAMPALAFYKSVKTKNLPQNIILEQFL
jgi:hypothetical protein